MKRKSIIFGFTILIVAIAISWASYEQGSKSRMVDCLVVELGLRVKENSETLSLLDKGDIEGAKSVSKKRLSNSEKLLLGYRRKICTEMGQTVCQRLDEIEDVLRNNDF